MRSMSAAAAADGKYDVVVVGGGPGGYVSAIKSAQLGLKTVCVESRGSLGGTCLNVGCIPSKALLQSTHHYHDIMHNMAQHGIAVDPSGVSFSVEKMLDSKAKTVTGLTGGIEHLLKKYGATYVKGKGAITGPNTVVSANLDGTETTITALFELHVYM